MAQRSGSPGPDRRRLLWAPVALLLVGLTLGTGSSGSVPSPLLREASATNPTPPSNVSVAGDDRALTVSWTAPNEPFLSGYRVYLDGALVASPTQNATSVRVPGLVNGQAYVVTVASVTTPIFGGTYVGTTTSTPVTGIPRDSVPPAAPTGVVAVRGDGQVTVSWTANSVDYDADGYRLLRDGVAVTALLPGRGTTARTDSGLVNDRTYGYAVQTHDTSGNWSASSTPVVTATPTDLTPPVAPTGLAAVRGDGRVDLSWSANSEPDVVSYLVLRGGVEVATVTGTAYADTTVVNDTTYAYALVAVDGHGNRSPASSPEVNATPTDLTPPAAPTGLAAVRGDSRVDLSWPANSEPDVVSYRVLRGGVEVATVTGTAYADTSVTNDVPYAYALVAVDGHGNRSPASSPEVNATPTDLSPPGAPTGLVAVRGDSRVDLSWPANPEADVASYRVLRDGSEIATVTGTTYADTTVVNDTTYGYALVAVDGHGNRSLPSSPVVSATPTDLTRPGAPTGLVATPGEERVDLAWAPNPEPDVISYRVLRDGSEIATVTSPAYQVTGLVDDDVPHDYSVVAVDGHGNRSGASAPVSAAATDVTAPSTPTGLGALPGDGRVDLSWPANPEPDVVAYRVLRDGSEIATVPGTSYRDTAVVNDTTYGYALVAVDGHGNRSLPSSPVVSATPTDLTRPGPPTGLVATPAVGAVDLSWDPAPEPDVVAYEVSRDSVVIATVPTPGSRDTGLTDDLPHRYSVVAVDGHGNRSDPSAEVTAARLDRTPPSPPGGVTATPGDGQAAVRWTGSPEPDVAGYEVLLADGTIAATVAAPGTSATITGLTNGTAYQVTVRAVDASGNVSDPSAPVTVTPRAPAVPAEGAGESGGLAASRDGRYVVVGTRARLEASDTNTAYELYLVDRSAGSARRIAPLPATATGATDPTNTSAPAISDDGRYVVLATTAALLPADTNRLTDVYRRDLQTGTWSLVSVPKGGGVSATTAGTTLQTGVSVYATSPSVAVSATGDVVLFYSARADLTTGDTNGVVDVFAKTMSTGGVTRVSTTATGASLGRTATGPALALTPDGRFALFPAAGSSGPTVLYRKTLSGTDAGALGVVSAMTVSGRAVEYGVQRDAGDVALSDDGRYVALVTAAKLAAGTPTASGPTGLAYRVDTATGALLALGNGQSTGWEHQVALDASGRYGFFATVAGELPGDGNGHTDHYRRDLDGGAPGPLVLVTADAGGAATVGPTGPVYPGEYGRVLPLTGDSVLVTTSQPLLAGDVNRVRDLYAKDLLTGAVTVPFP